MINLIYLINFLECGHFCINYVLKKEKKPKNCSYEKCMMNLRLIRDVLKEYFEEVNWFKNVNIEEIDNRCVSMINVRGKYYHYVVIEKIKGDYVFYYDPLFLLLRKEKISKFKKKWTNLVCLYQEKSNC